VAFVVDNSVVVGWYFESQATGYTDHVLNMLASDTAHVPSLWVLEFSNVLRKAMQAGRADPERTSEIIELVSGLPFAVDYTPVGIADNLKLATKYGLSSYDAAYLELALRLRLPMAAKDGALRSAATRAGVGLVE
jgi:predicted nucleic acid-binding protein